MRDDDQKQPFLTVRKVECQHDIKRVPLLLWVMTGGHGGEAMQREDEGAYGGKKTSA